MRRRALITLLMLLVLLGGINVWCWSRLQAAMQASAETEQDASRCAQLEMEIKRLQTRPTIAGSHEIELTELSRRIEQAAADAQIPEQGLVRISPEAARRLDSAVPGQAPAANDPPYLEKPTTVLLSGVTLAELTSFLYTMSTGSSAMDVQSLRISAPRLEETSDQWTAEITFSYLIYAPSDGPAVNGPTSLTLSNPVPTGGRMQP